MYCENCGSENPEKNNFCKYCGAPLHTLNPAREEQADAEALYEMGENYWEGRNGVSKNYVKAVEYYGKASDLGHIEAIYSLGYCYANGTGVEKDVSKAEKLLTYAIDHGHIQAAAKLGDYYYWGVVFPEDKAKGYRYLKYAADHGDAHSMAIVGRAFLSGIGAYDGWGPARDQELGRQYLERGCEKKDAYALFETGVNYCGGYEGFPKDTERGIRYLRESAELGHSYAQLEYAIKCWNGDGVPKSPMEYAKWMQKSAENGHEEAIIRWAWTRYTGIVDGVRCQNEMEFQECRNILEQGLANGDSFMMNVKDAMDDIHSEEARLGRRLRMEDFYGTPSPQQASGGGCYIATSVYGAYDCPSVWTLRRYRDYDLATTPYGRMFIKIYYKVSPILVRHFGDSRLFKSFFRRRLDKMVIKLKKRGYEDTPYTDYYA